MKQLRKGIRLVSGFLALLLLALVAFGAYSVQTSGSRWFASSANSYARSVRSSAIAGSVFDRNGVVLAASDPDGKRIFHPDRVLRQSVVHVLGDPENRVANGTEFFMSHYLYAFNETWREKFDRLRRGTRRRGNDITLSIDAGLSRRIAGLFPPGKSGAAVVMNYRTGEVLALQSFPSFDPSHRSGADEDNPLKPYWNRATQWTSAPGSTFKTVTLAALLEDRSDPDTKRYDCAGSLPLADGLEVTDAGNAVHGVITLRKAFALSCNVSFAQAALEIGDERLRSTARSFGFGDYFLFQDLVVENSRYPETNRTEREIAWTGAGQSALAASPLHMCMVAAAVANDGLMMEPRILLKAVSAEGIQKTAFVPRVYRRALEASQANLLKSCMRSAVLEGTASAAGVQGLAVCGKTGSAQVNGQEESNAWFIGFADDPRLPVAVCIAVENAGSGGGVAAPLAAAIFRYLMQQQQSPGASCIRNAAGL